VDSTGRLALTSADNGEGPPVLLAFQSYQTICALSLLNITLI